MQIIVMTHKIGSAKGTKYSKAFNKCKQPQETTTYYTTLKNVYWAGFAEGSF